MIIRMGFMPESGYAGCIAKSTTVKRAVVAPIPSARFIMTTAVKPGFLRSVRSATRTSPLTASTGRVRIDATSSMSPASRRIASSCGTPPARSAQYSSSRCCRISSLMPRGHSGMFDSGVSVDGVGELAPRAALRREDARTGGGQPVVAAPALARFLDPAADDPAALLEPVQQRIQRGDAEFQHAARSRLDQLAQVVAVARLIFDERQDEELGAPLLELAVQGARLDILHSDILPNGI